MRRLAALALMSLSTAGLAGDDAAAPVVAVIKLDKGDWAPVFAEKPTALMKLYFTEGFNASWVAAMRHNHDEPVLDGDPVTGAQSVTAVKLQSTKVGQSGDATTVTAQVLISQEGEKKPQPETIVFTMKREAGAYRIDDISVPDQPSLRGYFRKKFGG